MFKWYIENMIYATSNLFSQIKQMGVMYNMKRKISKYYNPQTNEAEFFVY